MELGGHAPAIVFDDADVDAAAKILGANKFRNAGQVCVAPTRFLVQEPVYAEFVGKFVTAAKAIKVGDGLDDKTRMGPLAHSPAARRHGGVRRRRGRQGRQGRDRRQAHRQQGLLLRADRAHQRAARRPHHERGAVRPGRRDRLVRDLRRRDDRGEPAALRARRLRVHALGKDRRARQCDRERHDLDQPPRPGAAGGAVRRREGFGLRLRRRPGGARGLSQHQVHHAARISLRSMRAKARTITPSVARAAQALSRRRGRAACRDSR